MDQAHFQLAKKAAANKSLMAALIERQVQRENASWAKVADMLGIRSNQLAKLALCEQPREDFFRQDVAQIAGYSGINQVVLLHFLKTTRQGRTLQKAVVRPALPAENKRNFGFMLKPRTWAVGAAALLLLLLGAFVLAQPGGTEATLVVSAGQVVVNQAGGAIFAGSGETAVSSGEVTAVAEGDTIRLGDNASAQLRLKDGSTIDLSSGTVLSVSELVATDESFRARFSLLTGKTFSQVVRLLKPGDSFEIKTPSSTASVRGTMFTVEVLSNEATFIDVSEGVVQVSLGDEAVAVAAGNEVTAVVGQPLQVIPTSRTAPEPTNTAEPTREPIPDPTNTETAVPTEEPSPTATEEPATETPEPDEPDDLEIPDEEQDPDAEEPQGKVLICHYPGGDQEKGVEIEIALEAWPAHQAHGDLKGTCPIPVDTADPVADPTNTPVPPATNTPIPPPTATPVPPPTATEESGGLVTICHAPPGNPDQKSTIQVLPEEVADHLAHGDSLGACP